MTSPTTNFFTQIGLAEELGSGTRNLFKCSRLYTGKDPLLDDGDFFRAFVPVSQTARSSSDAAAASGSEAAMERGTVGEIAIGLLAKQDRVTSGEIAVLANGSRRTVRRHLASMVEKGILEMERKGRSTSYRLKK